MKIEKVLVVFGGPSPEREVSIRSSFAVVNALKEAGYNVTSYDPNDGEERLLKYAKDSDVVFPVLHGEYGEDGQIQKIFESHNILFLGSDSNASAIAFNKVQSHKVLEGKVFLMPRYAVISKQDRDHEILSKPFVLKPIEGGSSVDTLIARKIDDKIRVAAKELLQKYDEMIVEELIDGIEVTIGVLGDDILPLITIIPPPDGEFDYENKYNGATQEICPTPQDLVSRYLQDKAQLIAYKVHSILKARDLSRVDMMIDSQGKIYVLELNTFPGMTNQSLYPKSALVAGYSMPDLMTKFINLVEDRSYNGADV